MNFAGSTNKEHSFSVKVRVQKSKIVFKQVEILLNVWGIIWTKNIYDYACFYY